MNIMVCNLETIMTKLMELQYIRITTNNQSLTPYISQTLLITRDMALLNSRDWNEDLNTKLIIKKTKFLGQMLVNSKSRSISYSLFGAFHHWFSCRKPKLMDIICFMWHI